MTSDNPPTTPASEPPTPQRASAEFCILDEQGKRQDRGLWEEIFPDLLEANGPNSPANH